MSGEIELLDDARVGQRDVGTAVGQSGGRFWNKLGVKCRDGDGATWIPRCFCLGTGGEQSPISLGSGEGCGEVGSVFLIVKVI